MGHFSTQSWTDFVRGISDSEQAEMAFHLGAGCKECTETHGFWKRVRALAMRELTCAPPEDIVSAVKAELKAQFPWNDTEPALANLVFDSFANPLLAGVRSIGAAARQMMYEANGLMVDLRVDSGASNAILLIGQVLDKEEPPSSAENAAVTLWTDRGLAIAKTKANRLGEFNLELEPQNDLRLSIHIVGRALIRVPLVNLTQRSAFDVVDRLQHQ
jgi:hypothetical protein